jgi:hypothetical protein
MPKKLLSPDAVREFLTRRFNNQHQNWLAAEGTWPLVVSLGTPTEKDIADDTAAVRAWTLAWQVYSGPGEVVSESRQFARLGTQRFPVALRLEVAAAVARAVGQEKRWATASERYGYLAERWPALVRGMALASRFNVLADYADDDFERLVSLLAWLDANPASNLYLRQLPIEGLDTKWVGQRTGLIGGLLRELKADAAASDDFHALCGLRKAAHRVRIRLLCPELRKLVGGLCDIEAPANELATLPIEPSAVVIVENLETGLALPDMPGTVAVMRLGNAVSVLAVLPWLRGAKAVYWGDIDTHGFAILARARQVLPQLRSVMMDEKILCSHRSLWVREPVQYVDPALEGLHGSEKAVYEGLRTHAWGQNVRLEQERLVWEAALQTLQVSVALP